MQTSNKTWLYLLIYMRFLVKTMQLKYHNTKQNKKKANRNKMSIIKQIVAYNYSHDFLEGVIKFKWLQHRWKTYKLPHCKFVTKEWREKRNVIEHWHRLFNQISHNRSYHQTLMPSCPLAVITVMQIQRDKWCLKKHKIIKVKFEAVSITV